LAQHICVITLSRGPNDPKAAIRGKRALYREQPTASLANGVRAVEFRETIGLGNKLYLPSLETSLALADTYALIEFGAEEE
jgi:hypothetical protein